MSQYNLLTLELRLEHDVVLARQRARQLAGLLGFSAPEQTRIATAVSELARNAYQYAGGGRARFVVETEPVPLLAIVIEDQGPGIRELEAVLDGAYVSKTGMGLGLVGARRLMDEFHVETAPGRGTAARVGKHLPLPARPVTGSRVAQIAAELARAVPESPLAEVQRQNQELLRTLAEMARLNHELDDTNRGVVALYAELDEHARSLKQANELKSQFLSHLSHEFRTPLNAIDRLSQLLLEGAAGPLASEQEKPLALIRQSARDLTDLVNDLLDLAKIEAGKMGVRPTEFSVEDLFAALRGMLRPLLDPSRSLALHFAPVDHLPPLFSDESKVAQILRNFISNALKYTEAGEVGVAAEPGSEDTLRFRVSDTGIGINPADQERIWDEFVQVEGAHQKRAKGTGLGLPLCRKLAGLLGGAVEVQSEPGRGSVFTLTLPRCIAGSLPAEEVASHPDG